ncbi:endonuclease [Prauserella marina]|uniref:Metal-dependent hydrolase, endonuclease/exonuclease/phosphatase family n=1 Tax=Prauserella marina TaxID=530584 RepID=A0A222VYM6_9PSEU|nr:endonuclease/exonuclease/phosphatase family protein [Prauserella marina]ASR39039.1 endonuclease [Prauserella marina]PWV85608.1 endonuclease/exonuclease/phosphatase family metal-dependent hydrolase [Prauserella marina]SDC50581.1 Metal-dependent hydrolase, endonuclease/exonuclease/phosphatase family [Prauserella marina]
MRVLTWNLWWRFGPWERRREAIAAVLRDLRPDVAGLQEVWAADGDNLARWLANELGMHWTFAQVGDPRPWQRRIGDPAIGVGNAVLSRWPITARQVAELPGVHGEDRGRIALHARIAAPGHDLPFFTTHLAAAADASAVRCEQVKALATFVAAHRDGTSFPPVITGDFNARPDSDEIQLFGGYKTAPAVAGQVLLDAWEHASPTQPSATWDTANPFVAVYFGPSARVDYIHVGPPGPGGLGDVTSVRRAGDAAHGGVWPSDHAAVVADLRDA